VNIFSHLPGLGKKVTPRDDVVELTDEEQAAQAKAERIEIHRTQVRNGPAKWSHVTSGQIRRAAKRAQDREVRKNFKREVNEYLMKQRVAATLRPHLQVLGLVSTYDNRVFSLHDEVVSTGWITQRYGRETEVDGVKTGHVSFLHEDVLAAIKAAAQFYESATGYRITVPADFEVAIYAEAANA